MTTYVGRALEPRAITLEQGWTYRVYMADGKACSFDMTNPRQTWILPPPADRGVPRDARRQDWMLVLDETVELRRGSQLSVQVFEDSGSVWTWMGSTPNRVVRVGEGGLPISMPWR